VLLARAVTRLDVSVERIEVTLGRIEVTLDGYTQRQDAINARLATAIERLDATQADITRLLERLLQPGDNGQSSSGG
jgi:hypothetical protein